LSISHIFVCFDSPQIWGEWFIKAVRILSKRCFGTWRHLISGAFENPETPTKQVRKRLPKMTTSSPIKQLEI